MVAPHLALVGNAGEPARAGQHRKQRQFGQRDRGRAVIDQHDVIGGKRKLVAAARGGAADGADGGERGILAHIFDAVARLVGELAEVDFVRVACAGEHADVGARAEHARLARAQHHDANLRVLEAQAVERIGKLDVDAEIVGIEFEVVALEQRTLLVDVHQQRRDVAVGPQLPVPVARRIGLEINPGLAVCQRTFHRVRRISHGRLPLGVFGLRTCQSQYLSNPGVVLFMYYNAYKARWSLCIIMQ